MTIDNNKVSCSRNSCSDDHEPVICPPVVCEPVVICKPVVICEPVVICNPKPCNPKPCPPEPCHPEPCKPIIAANEYGYITGDPHLRGGDGEYFDLNPQTGIAYNALTDKNLSYQIVVGDVQKWGQSTGVVSSTITVSGQCKKSIISFNKCGTATLKTTDSCGNVISETTITRCNTYTLADGGTVKYGMAYGGGSDGLTKEERLIINTKEGYEITQAVRDGAYIDSNIQTGSNGVYSDGVLPTGLIGDTFDAGSTPRVAVDDKGTGVLNNPLSYYQVGNNIVVEDLKPHYDNYNNCNNSCGTDDNDIFYSDKKRHSWSGYHGDDLYFVNHKKDHIFENKDEGNDGIISSVNHTLCNNVENLRLSGKCHIRGIGNLLDNLMIGNTGNNILDGGAGDDTIIGGKGNDVYYVDSTSDEVLENENGGIDTVISSIDYSLGNNVENLTLIGCATDAKGNELNNKIIGNSADNVIVGGEGNDILKGGAGDDVYEFAAGDGVDVIDDKCGSNKIVFDESVSSSSIGFKYIGKDLLIDYGDTSSKDTILVKNARCNQSLEIELSDGNYLTMCDINKVVTNMTAYCRSEHICISTMFNIKSAQHHVMAINPGCNWHCR